jgi:hypothetical protein
VAYEGRSVRLPKFRRAGIDWPRTAPLRVPRSHFEERARVLGSTVEAVLGCLLDSSPRDLVVIEILSTTDLPQQGGAVEALVTQDPSAASPPPTTDAPGPDPVHAVDVSDGEAEGSAATGAPDESLAASTGEALQGDLGSAPQAPRTAAPTQPKRGRGRPRRG